MKESNSNTRAAVKLLLGFLGVLAFLVSYFLVLPNLQAQREELEKENEILKEQQRIVTDLDLNKETYRTQAELYEKEIADIIDKYPAYILEEDAILFARELEKGEGVFDVSVVAMTPANLLYAMNQQLPAASGTEETQTSPKGGVDLGILDESAIVCPDYSLYSVAANYDFTTDYRSMKLAYAQIMSHVDKRNVPSMAMSRDDLGMLYGNLNVNLYYLTNTGKIYHKPDPGVIVKGNENPFGTLVLPEVNNTEDDTGDGSDDVLNDLT